MYFKEVVAATSLLLATLLSGCAGGPTVRMNAADKTTIRQVTVNTMPALPPKMFFHGRSQSFAVAGGLLGAVLASSAPKEPPEQILDTMKQNSIDLPSILKSEFFAVAESRGLLSQVESGTLSQGDLKLIVNVYGFGQTQGFSALLYPLLNVTATITKPNGEIAWQRTDFASPMNAENKYGYSFEQYLAEPELLRKTLANISGVVSRMLADDLAGGR